MIALRKAWLLIIVLLASLADAAPPAQVSLHHELNVRIDPGRGMLKVDDRVTLPPGSNGRFRFHLYPGLQLGRVTGLTEPEAAEGVPVRVHALGGGDYEGLRLDGVRWLRIRYQGTIRQALNDISDSPGKRQQWTRGWIGDDGVFLDGAAPWYPRFGDQLLTFDLRVQAPPGWRAVSQGQPLGDNHWRETHPQDDIYLIANYFRVYQQSTPNGLAQVFLRQLDPVLAQRYLDATQTYLALYSRLLGPYPYAKFALVENFWESGYGMPSFTLLGPQVLRLPFIIHSAYPHEILHNWFGNGVYVDYARGNWSEGLTTYLADHFLKAQQGQGAAYRREALQRYARYAAKAGAFPLSHFTARHGDASQAIGYSKAMMVFHMLHRRLGDEIFFAGLRRFVRDYRFKRASYSDLQHSWEQASGRPLARFFDQWLERPGAPRLALGKVTVKRIGGQYRLDGVLRQTQAEPPFELRVPVVIQLTDGKMRHETIPLDGRSQAFHWVFESQPLSLAVDPDFDLFRQLDPAEIPMTLSAFFGSEKATLVLPAQAPEPIRQGYAALARDWAAKRPGWRVTTDADLDRLPDSGAILVLGWQNRFRDTVLHRHGKSLLQDGQVSLAGQTVNADKFSIVTAVTGPDQQPRILLTASQPAAIAGLARKLPHYGKYSYLAFTGATPDIKIKGQWAVSSEANPYRRMLTSPGS